MTRVFLPPIIYSIWISAVGYQQLDALDMFGQELFGIVRLQRIIGAEYNMKSCAPPGRKLLGAHQAKLFKSKTRK